ncbi:MAG: RES family NAD+ phosphorylase [Rhodobacteraceae bacterium]|nr:RES family NAD+ phosphorylase [Paracoccaceae bacterium]
MTLRNERYKGFLFRALHKKYSKEPLSGRGAELYGGRFNPRGTPALYTSLEPGTTFLEVKRAGPIGNFVLIKFSAKQWPIFDTRDTKEVAKYGLSKEDLANPGWINAMESNRSVPTQDLAIKLIEDGYAGLLVQSFVKGATHENLNLVLWHWNVGENILEVESSEEVRY